MSASPFPFAHSSRFQAARRQAAIDYCQDILHRATPAQEAVCRGFFLGQAAGNHGAVDEVNSYECSLSGEYLNAHRTFRFQDTGQPAFDFRTQLVRIERDGTVHVI